MDIDNQRWKDIYTYLERPGPFIGQGFEPGDAVKEFLHSCTILVVGAGGLGCELLKDLAMSGFKDIHVIDMDTIDVSNLNRQFLFRQKDVGQSKAQVAAQFIMNRVEGCIVTPHFCKIQDKDIEYYSQFSVIICGLDSVEARRWMNAIVYSLYEQGNLIPLIDGGTEGFKGQSRVILPSLTACFECSLEMQTKPTTYPLCTIANTPRLPEHCIEYASVFEWSKTFPETAIDTDNPDHVKWIFETASNRANQYQIKGVTYALAQGVIKNIIPAIASTNAIIAASCSNEAFKLVTSCAPSMDNYMMYVGDNSIYTYTFKMEKKEGCPVCGNATITLKVSKTETLKEFMEILLETPEIQLKAPSIRSNKKTLYMRAPKSLEESTRPNLDYLLISLIEDNDTITVTDQNLPLSLQITVQFE